MKLTIAVAIYNLEDYIERCVESLLKIKLDYTYEILLINDGSTDKTNSILRKYEKIEKIRIIEKLNSGLPDVRNLSIKEARGEYIAFLDGDDYIDENIYNILLKEIEDKQIDMPMCSFYWDYTKKIKKDRRNLKEKKYIGIDIYKELLLENINTSVWNKLFKRKILIDNELKFPQIRGAEDYEFIFKYLKYIESFSYIEKPLMYYYQRNMSLSSEKTQVYLLNNIDVLISIFEIVKVDRSYKELKEYLTFYLVNRSVYLLREILKLEHIDKNLKRKTKEFIELINLKEILSNKFLKRKTKIRFLKIKFLKKGAYNE